MLKFYYHPSPNPAKIALFLEEAGLEYEVIPVDTRKGDQFSPEYLAVNPNAKTPAIVDGDIRVFDSSAILLYLGQKTGKFVSENASDQSEMLSWLMLIATGVGPYSGQAVHFKYYAPEQNAYAINRYTFEVERHFKIIEAQLAKGRYMIGHTYTIADMALWGWGRAPRRLLGEEIWEQQFPNLRQLMDEIDARPAAIRVKALAEKYAFKEEMDEVAQQALFPHNARLASPK